MRAAAAATEYDRLTGATPKPFYARHGLAILTACSLVVSCGLLTLAQTGAPLRGPPPPPPLFSEATLRGSVALNTQRSPFTQSEVRREADGSVVVRAALSLPIVGDRDNRGEDDGIVFEMRNEEPAARALTSWDSSFNCALFELPDGHDTSAYDLTEITPVLDTAATPDDPLGLVHHMDLTFCETRALAHLDAHDANTCNDLMGGPTAPEGCNSLVWAYDRGANAPWRAPADASVRVGKGTRYQFIALQVHYLLPAGCLADCLASLVRRRVVDTSGLELRFTPASSVPTQIGALAFMGIDMAVPPHATGFKYAVTLRGKQYAGELGAHLAYARQIGQPLRLRQVHLHAHHHATSVALTRTRSGVSRVVRSLEHYCGYGACQHLLDVEDTEAAELREGDELTFTCVFDNPTNVTLRYGTSNLEEMCGPVVLFTPRSPADVQSELPMLAGKASYTRSNPPAPQGKVHRHGWLVVKSG